MNAVETFVRALIDFAGAAAGKDWLQLVYGAMGLIDKFVLAQEELKGMPDADQSQILQAALDNLIGSEANALIGPNGKIFVDLSWFGDDGLEKLSDLLKVPIANQLAKVM